MVNIAKAQDAEVGDGTTSVTVLASELLREAEKLVDQKIHPQTIISGWRKAAQIAEEALTKASVDNSENDGMLLLEANTRSILMLFFSRKI